MALWATLGLGLALPAAASAQTAVGALPAVPPGNPIPRVAPRAAPSVSPGLQGLPATPPGGPVPNVPVDVASASVEGATAFTSARLARITAGLVGPAVPLPRIAAARLAILDLYRRHGYVLTAVSATLDAAHHLHFIVTEGRVVAVKLSGNIGPAGTQVLRFLHHLTEVRPITSAALERWLLLAQDIPGISIRAVLQPSTTEPGALTLIAQVHRSPVSGLITADNRAFQNTGPDEGLAVFDLNSFTSLGEKTEISLY
ncbi:MAG: POTRA domain-containing protein, partial [Acetobacteraceae bacterium]